MIEFLTNPAIVLLVTAFIITSLLFLFVGKKKKPKKIEKVIEPQKKAEDNQKTQKSEEINENIINNNQNEENLEEIVGFDKVDEAVEDKNKKSIKQVYIRKQKEINQSDESTNQEEQKYQELSERAEFVRTSKQISKLKGFGIESLEEHQEDIAQQVREDIDNCKTCDEIKSRIDHSRRLSASIKNDNLDDLFVGHITEHYLKIDAERHLSKDIEQKIFERTNRLMTNVEMKIGSDNRISDYGDVKNDKDKLRSWLEQNKNNYSNQEDFEDDEAYDVRESSLSLKNLVLADLILKRISKKQK